MQNIITVAEIKRRGMAAIEEGLEHGPLHIVKRNRPAAVVLSEQEFARLSRAQTHQPKGLSAVQWLLAHAGEGERDKTEVDATLRRGGRR